ncbi:TetR/AcrR family transcriptional regulator [Rhizorhabdus argentea]|uniref:TetR/AcrR family transcriptional regulator n=1 Tax=Rhizorhabdus argentea TaxID=1387174 RepID=UPI0030EB48E1
MIDAALAALTRKSHVDMTLGEIAKIAGTQPSMIRYYFGNMDGLLTAVSDHLTRHTEERLAEAEKELDPEKGAAEPIVRALVGIYYNLPFAAARSIMVIEALRPGSSLIGNFRSRTAKKIVVRMIRMIRSSVAHGTYSWNLDVRTAVLSIMSMTTGPMACIPMLDAGQNGATFDQEAWIRHAGLMLDKSFRAEAIGDASRDSAASE